MRALLILAGLEQIIPLPIRNGAINKRGILMEDLLPLGLDARVLTGHILIVHGDDGVLRHVLDHVGRGVRVGHVGVLLVVGPEVVGGGEGLAVVGAFEVERVPGFVQDHGEHVVVGLVEDDVAVGFEGPSVGRWHVHDVAHPLAHLDRDFAELACHAVDVDSGCLVVAEDPRGSGALVSVVRECALKRYERGKKYLRPHR